MNCWFSGIDQSELHDNAPNHHYYLSLIVNHKTKYCAKIAYVAEHAQETVEYIDFKGRRIELNTPKVNERKLITMNCDIVIDYGNGGTFSERIKSLIAEKEERKRIAATKVLPTWNKQGEQRKIHLPNHLPSSYPRTEQRYGNTWTNGDISKFGSNSKVGKSYDMDAWDEELLNEAVYFPVEGGEEVSDMDIEAFLIELIAKGNQSAYFTINSILDEQEMNVKKYIPNKLTFSAKFKRLFKKHFEGQEAEMDVIIDCCLTYLKSDFMEYNATKKYVDLIDGMYEEID